MFENIPNFTSRETDLITAIQWCLVHKIKIYSSDCGIIIKFIRPDSEYPMQMDLVDSLLFDSFFKNHFKPVHEYLTIRAFSFSIEIKVNLNEMPTDIKHEILISKLKEPP